MFKLSLSCVIAVFLLVGCSSVAFVKTDNGATEYASTSAKNIQVYATYDAGRDYSVIGEVVAAADAGESADVTVKHMKAQAAEVGGDAIINLRLEIVKGFWTSGVRGTGTVVKFK